MRLLTNQIGNNRGGAMPNQMRSHSAGHMQGGNHFNNQGGFNNQRGGGNFQQRGPNQGNNYNNRGPMQQQQRPMPPANMPPMPPQNMPMIVNQGNGPQVTPSNDPRSQEFYAKTMAIFAAINEMNPNYKQQVGSAIFDFVSQTVGPNGPKITGMLIDLPVLEIQRFCTNYDLFVQRVQQSQNLLSNQPQKIP